MKNYGKHVLLPNRIWASLLSFRLAYKFARRSKLSWTPTATSQAHSLKPLPLRLPLRQNLHGSQRRTPLRNPRRRHGPRPLRRTPRSARQSAFSLACQGWHTHAYHAQAPVSFVWPVTVFHAKYAVTPLVAALQTLPRHPRCRRALACASVKLAS